jgi:uncharacterized protein YjlB
MEAGDIAVHPAGVAHRNEWSTDDYLYMGLYPKGSPKWNNNFCKANEEETNVKAEQAKEVPVPDYDPIVSTATKVVDFVLTRYLAVWS